MLLTELLDRAGSETRLVSWEYALPPLAEVQQELAFSTDVHTAVQVRVGEGWLLADATHDPALAPLGLTVNDWDGSSPTAPAYRALGPLLVHQDEGDARLLDAVIRRVGQGVEATDPDLVAEYQRTLNELFERTCSAR